MQVKKQRLEPNMQQQSGSETGKLVWQGIILSPCLFIWHPEFIEIQAEYIM